ncbi:MAG: hypothetical protein QOE70_5057 [Chthoniobacter sp.]|jgi:hypothetical protein|nr:hypothetical protein [Chthoniobacter sp.]
MSRQRLLALVFLGVALVQIALPAGRIWLYERTLREGQVFKFRTAPVDPSDAFRGRYVTLRFEASDAAWTANEPPPFGTKVWVGVAQGTDGFAHFTSASSKRPAEGDFLELRTSYGGAPGRVALELPFDRFYMEESAAPNAERLYAERNRRGGARDTYAAVRIRNGRGAIEQVFVGDKPLAEAAKEIGAK